MSEILEKFKKFQARSKAAFSSMMSRITDNRKMLSGDQWRVEDDKFIAKSRNRLTINIVNNQVHSVANTYSSYPFVWFTGDQEIDKRIDEFFSADSNRFASQEAVLDAVSFGLGVLALGSDTDANGENIPVIYAVSDIERVMLDPDSVEMDGSDAMEGALIDYRSREWIRVHMGEEYVPGENKKSVLADTKCGDLIPIITYYSLDTDGCHVHTFVNDIEVQSADGVESVIPIHRIPIFPVWGERSWDGDKKTYVGIVEKSKDIQHIVNYAFTQLGERLALSPKPQWQGYAEMFKNLDAYYKNAGSGNNPILPSNRLANDKKTVLDLPKRLDNTVQFSDVNGIIESSLELLSSITGVDSKGIIDANTDVTATAVMYTAKVFQNNIRHYFAHLRTSFKALGDAVMTLWGYNGVKLDVTQGPENYMELQTARQELTALMPVVEPNQKRAIVNSILRTHPDNEILAQLYGELNSIQPPTEMEQKLQNLCEQMKNNIDEKDAQIAELTAQVQAFQQSERNYDKSLIADFLKNRQAHEFKMEEQAQKAALDAGMNAEKAQADAAKAAIELEGKAAQVEVQKAKAAAEIAKTAQPVIVGGNF